MLRNTSWQFDIRQLMAAVAMLGLLAWLYARYFLVGIFCGTLLIGLALGLHGVYRKRPRQSAAGWLAAVMSFLILLFEGSAAVGVGRSTVMLTFIVTDGQTDRPLRNAAIRLCEVPDPQVPVAPLSGGTQVATDEQGRCCLAQEFVSTSRSGPLIRDTAMVHFPEDFWVQVDAPGCEVRLVRLCDLVGRSHDLAANKSPPTAHVRLTRRKFPGTRREFAAAMSMIEKGMPAAEVLKRLGYPDRTRTDADPWVASIADTKEVWQYGTSADLSTATLGQVFINRDHCVQYIYGKGVPPPEHLFEEDELRRLLDALGKVSSYNGAWRYNPRPVIEAVNLLQPLGKEKAIAVIDEYLRVTSYFLDEGREGVFLVLRTLFEVPDDPGCMPPMRVGAPTQGPPHDPKLLPRYPIAIEGDIPFLLVEGYTLAGFPEQPSTHVDYFRKQGMLRTRPLVPTSDPFQAIEEFANSPRWPFTEPEGFNKDSRGRNLLMNQALLLVDSVYRPASTRDDQLLPPGGENSELRKKILAEASSLKIRWNDRSNKYVFLDGTSLPERN